MTESKITQIKERCKSARLLAAEAINILDSCQSLKVAKQETEVESSSKK